MTAHEYAHGPNPMRVHLAELFRSTWVAACHRPGAHRLTHDPAAVTCAVCARYIVKVPR